MDSLKRLLGPAPSEASSEELFERIKRERARAFKFKAALGRTVAKAPKRKTKRKKAEISEADVLAVLRARGVPESKIQEVMKGVEI